MLSFVVSEIENAKNYLGIGDKISVIHGDKFSALRAIAPYGKFAALYNTASFSSFGKSFTERAKLAGFKPLNFILPDFATLNFSGVFDVIGVPEDVRAIVFFDAELCGIALYIASLFGVPCVYILTAYDIGEFFADRIAFSYEKFSDLFPVSCARTLVIDDSFISKADPALALSLFTDITVKSLAIADILAFCHASGQALPDFERALSVAENAVKNAFSIDISNTAQCVERLFTDKVLFALSDFSVKGKLICNSAGFSFLRLCGKSVGAAVKYGFYKRALALYMLAVENQTSFDLPEYIGRAETLGEITAFGESAFLNGFIKQTEILSNGGAERAIDGAKKYLSEIIAVASAVDGVYRSLGGTETDFSPFIKALKYCGDLPDTFNFMTVVRANGITESIK